MNPDEFTLQPSDVPQPQLLDEEVATKDWPLPLPRTLAPAPRPSLFWQLVEALW